MTIRTTALRAAQPCKRLSRQGCLRPRDHAIGSSGAMHRSVLQTAVLDSTNAVTPAHDGGPDRRFEPIVNRQAEHQIGEMNHLITDGKPLANSDRMFFEPRFGRDLRGIRVHETAEASTLAHSLRARAFTVGSSIVLGKDARRETATGRRLLAHEIAHVVQQNGTSPHIQRENVCSDPDFCKPYATARHAAMQEAILRAWFIPTMNAKFGSEVAALWDRYLSRSPGSSLTPTVFDTDGDPIEDSFATSADTESDIDDVLDLVIGRVSRHPGGRLRPGVTSITGLSNYLSSHEMENRPINYSNPLAKAGNIAGGIGSSDAGADQRKIIRANVTMTKTEAPLLTNGGWITFKLTPRYEVIDAVDLCPGQCGSPLEQAVTITLSRLEESGEAYDVPYVVRFSPEPVSNTEFFSTFPI